MANDRNRSLLPRCAREALAMANDRNRSLLPGEGKDEAAGAEERHRHRRSKRRKEEDSSDGDSTDEQERGGSRKKRKRRKHRGPRRSSRRARGSSSEGEWGEDSSSSAASDSYGDSSEEDSSTGDSASEGSEGQVRRRRRRERRRKEREHEKERRRKEKERRRKEREHDKERRRKEKERRRKRKKEKTKRKTEKKEKDLGKKGAVTNSWGKYGVIRETDMWNKRPEFTAWVAEVKKVNLESLANWEEKQMFKDELQLESPVHTPKYHRSVRRVEQRVADVFLPLDIVAKILIWLPVKAILKFKCVCKSWCELISSEYLVDMHLELTKQSPKIILHPCCMYKPDHIKEFYSLGTECTADLVLRKLDCTGEGNGVMLLNACQGLNVLETRDHIHVVNVWTRESLRLPDHPAGAGRRYEYDECVGFGFSFTSKKYKVVWLGYHWKDCLLWTYRIVCEVYTLGGSGRWREVPPPPYPVVTYYAPVFYKGAIYWEIHRELCSPGPHALIAFDVEDETFQLVPLPPCTLLKEGEWHRLFVSQGCLWMRHFNRRTGIVCLWKSKDFPGSGAVWTMEYTVDMSILKPYTPCAVHDDKILIVDSCTGVICVDPKSGMMQDFVSLKRPLNYYDSKTRRMRNVWRGAALFSLTFFEESLVSLRDKK